jgi:hypothetical protein
MRHSLERVVRPTRVPSPIYDFRSCGVNCLGLGLSSPIFHLTFFRLRFSCRSLGARLPFYLS